METITGKIEAVSQKEKGYGVKIEGKWFNGWGKAPTIAVKDEVVQIHFEVDKFGNKIKHIVKAPEVVKMVGLEQSDKMVEIVDEEHINFMTKCVKDAINVYYSVFTDMDLDMEFVKSIACTFYINGRK